eukprot:10939749-Ditylum_brightwellii.AAC.1
MAKSGKFCGRLRGQSICIGKEFPFKKSLYVDDGAFLFTTRLKLHIDDTYKDSKTEAVFLPPPGLDPTTVDTSIVPVANGYITYTPSFKYLGSHITQDLSDTFDIKNWLIQANKAMASMMPH